MNDFWRNRTKGYIEQRAGRRFRHHVRTATNPKGRIHREACFWHPDRTGEFHHLDYDLPFKGVWCCTFCHREIDHGTRKVPKRAVCDYSSLVRSRLDAAPF